LTRIKICGITEKSNAITAIESVCDFIGLVFAPSRRKVSVHCAKEIVKMTKRSNGATQAVGVFVNSPAAIVNKIAIECGLDYVQLSGDESPAYCRQIDHPIIKAVRIGMRQGFDEICYHLNDIEHFLSIKPHIFLLDSLVEGYYGGTGVVADWSLFRKIARDFCVIIAGGLTPETVGQAIEMVSPWGVDVSSGVEIMDKKDNRRIRAFIDEVRKADDRKSHAVT
jgi:phosphoribosylanthranilate isomerase